MFCTKCGNQVPDGQKFCSACGNPMAPAQQPRQPQYGQPQQQYQQPQYGQPQYQQAAPAALGMGWFKFLIYFALFAGAVLNVIAAITSLTGAQYTYAGQNMSEIVYATFPGLQAVDLIYGIVIIALAVLQVLCRFRLAGFYKNGPMLLVLIYVVNFVSSIIYIIACSTMVEGIDISSTIPSLVMSVVMAVVNYVYFKKREHLFTR